MREDRGRVFCETMRSMGSAIVGLACVAAVSCSKPSTEKSSQPSIAAPAAAASSAPDGAHAPAANALAMLAAFDGEIDATIRDSVDGGAPVPVTLRVSKGKVRFDLPERLTRASGGPFGKASYVIFDSDAKKLFIISDPARQAMSLDLNEGGFLRDVGSGAPPAGPRPGPAVPAQVPSRITKTGKSDAVAGYACEEWDVTSDHREATVCVASQEVPWFAFPAAASLPTEKGWMAEFVDGKHVPLRFVSYGRDGVTEDKRVEVTKIDKKKLPASDFDPPAGYKVVDLGQTLKRLQGMSGGFPLPPATPRRSVQ